jgi:hypothetical protein
MPSAKPAPYQSLSKRGRLRRLRQIARDALTHYDLDIRDLTLRCLATNQPIRLG